jgi:hypothetical protein
MLKVGCLDVVVDLIPQPQGKLKAGSTVKDAQFCYTMNTMEDSSLETRFALACK